MNLLFNCDIPLWDNYRQSIVAQKKSGPCLTVVSGQIANEKEIIARCRDDAHARQVLIEAGWHDTGHGFMAHGPTKNEQAGKDGAL